MDLSVLSIYPQSTPAGNNYCLQLCFGVVLPIYIHFVGSSFELYTVLADYAGESENELTAKAGDVVSVIHKLDTGMFPRTTLR